MYDAGMGMIIFVPIAVLSWFPFISTFQSRLLFNQAFSRGLEISLILAGNKANVQSQRRSFCRMLSWSGFLQSVVFSHCNLCRDCSMQHIFREGERGVYSFILVFPLNCLLYLLLENRRLYCMHAHDECFIFFCYEYYLYTPTMLQALKNCAHGCYVQATNYYLTF